MLKNRFFKSTLGIPAEVIIAQSLDASNSPSAGTAPTATVNVTVAASPTAGDSLTIIVDGQVYTHTVTAGETTAALAVAGILAQLQANNQGFTAGATGTTTAVFTLTGPVGTSFNGKTVTGSEVGATFSAITTANFAGGVNPVVGFQSTYETFITTAAAGSIAAYWEDTHDAVTFGATKLLANQGRGYFYAWKQADGSVKRSTTVVIPAKSVVQVPYVAGNGDTWTLTFTGTYSVGQIIHVRIIDTTSTIIPYPSWEYTVVSTGTIATDVTALAVALNAENIDKQWTASGATNVLTVAFLNNSRTFKVMGELEPTKAFPTDASIITPANTVKAKSPIGTYADIKELENYFKVQQGATLYSGDGHVNPEEFGLPASNVVAGINYGILVLHTLRFERGEVRNFNQTLYVIIALPTASLATLAGL